MRKNFEWRAHKSKMFEIVKAFFIPSNLILFFSLAGIILLLLRKSKRIAMGLILAAFIAYIFLGTLQNCVFSFHGHPSTPFNVRSVRLMGWPARSTKIHQFFRGPGYFFFSCCPGRFLKCSDEPTYIFMGVPSKS